MTMRVTLRSQKVVARLTSHRPGVKVAVGARADAIAMVAEARLMAHRTARARHHIAVERGSTDSLISLIGPGAPSVEWGRTGHPDSGNPSYMAPLHILTGSVNL